MSELKDPIIKQINQISDDLLISKIEAAEALKRNFIADGLMGSAEHVQKWIDKQVDNKLDRPKK